MAEREKFEVGIKTGECEAGRSGAGAERGGWVGDGAVGDGGAVVCLVERAGAGELDGDQVGGWEAGWVDPFGAG